MLAVLLVSSELQTPKPALLRTLRFLSWADLLAILSQAMPVSAAVRNLAKRGAPVPSSLLRIHTKPGRPAGDAHQGLGCKLQLPSLMMALGRLLLGLSGKEARALGQMR